MRTQLPFVDLYQGNSDIMTSRQNPPRHESETSCSHRRTSESASSVIQSDMFSPDKYMPHLIHRSRHRLGFVSTGEGPDCQITLTGRHSHLLVSAKIDIFFTKHTLAKCLKICVFKTNKGLNAPTGSPQKPLQLPRMGNLGYLKALPALKFRKTSRVFDV